MGPSCLTKYMVSLILLTWHITSACIRATQWFANFFHLPTPWQPISRNCTLHIRKMFVINIVAVISNLYVDVCAFSHHYWIFRVPLGVRVPQVGNHWCNRMEFDSEDSFVRLFVPSVQSTVFQPQPVSQNCFRRPAFGLHAFALNCVTR